MTVGEIWNLVFNLDKTLDDPTILNSLKKKFGRMFLPSHMQFSTRDISRSDEAIMEELSKLSHLSDDETKKICDAIPQIGIYRTVNGKPVLVDPEVKLRNCNDPLCPGITKHFFVLYQSYILSLSRMPWIMCASFALEVHPLAPFLVLNFHNVKRNIKAPCRCCNMGEYIEIECEGMCGFSNRVCGKCKEISKVIHACLCVPGAKETIKIKGNCQSYILSVLHQSSDKIAKELFNLNKPLPVKCKTCNKLGGKNNNLKKCNGCNKVYYCNVECQKKDWKNHRNICKSNK
jgi:hypothetical protein